MEIPIPKLNGGKERQRKKGKFNICECFCDDKDEEEKKLMEKGKKRSKNFNLLPFEFFIFSLYTLRGYQWTNIK